MWESKKAGINFFTLKNNNIATLKIERIEYRALIHMCDLLPSLYTEKRIKGKFVVGLY